MNFVDAKWRKDIHPGPGWYAIPTNAPISVLAQVPLPVVDGKHYRIAKRIQDARFLIDQGAAIIPDEEGDS